MTDLVTLFQKALEARKNAYAPYSDFKVGAAVLTKNAKIYVGANTENVSFPCGTCAEEAAIAAMITNGERTISEIVVVANSKNLITPCGACLQRILEFSNSQTTVHLANLKGIQKSYKIAELLPVAFHEEFKK
ncbi:MAG TPA: cytidine deaminase [Alphaproteobacteria bacterium]|nr:cytidine deaminase [Alphaproteobacteria bacterium]